MQLKVIFQSLMCVCVFSAYTMETVENENHKEYVSFELPIQSNKGLVFFKYKLPVDDQFVQLYVDHPNRSIAIGMVEDDTNGLQVRTYDGLALLDGVLDNYKKKTNKSDSLLITDVETGGQINYVWFFGHFEKQNDHYTAQLHEHIATKHLNLKMLLLLKRASLSGEKRNSRKLNHKEVYTPSSTQEREMLMNEYASLSDDSVDQILEMTVPPQLQFLFVSNNDDTAHNTGHRFMRYLLPSVYMLGIFYITYRECNYSYPQ